MGCEFKIDSHKNRAWLRAAGMLCLYLFAGCCFVGHDQLKLPDPSPCHMQCEFDRIACLDPECHGYHPTCWAPWSGACPGCPPPVSGVNPVFSDMAQPESLQPPNPLPKSSAESGTKPAKTMPPPAETPSLPNEMPSVKGETKPAPAEAMPAPETKPAAPNEAAPPALPDLPPLVPPGKKIPDSSDRSQKSSQYDQDWGPPGVSVMKLFRTSSHRHGSAVQAGSAAIPTGSPNFSSKFAQSVPGELDPHSRDAAQPLLPVQTQPWLARSSAPIARPAEPIAERALPPNIVQTALLVPAPVAPAEQADAAPNSPDSSNAESASQPAEESTAEEPFVADPDDYFPLFRKVGGVFIVACTLAATALCFRRILGAAADANR